MVIRRTSSDWPRLLTPASGYFPLATTSRRPERLLHVALRDSFEMQPGLARALRSIGTGGYAEIDWRRESDIPNRILQLASQLRPTIVFMQLQGPSPIVPEVVRALRSRCAKDAVLIQWDGDDEYFVPGDVRRKWFVDLGRELDASLLTNTKHPAEYAWMSVRRPGYFQIGVDESLYRPTRPTQRTPPIVFLASNHPTHKKRPEIVDLFDRRFQRNFGVYGNGWRSSSAHPMLTQRLEASVYSASSAAISISSRNDLPRYTSDRLFRAMGSGALVLVERFAEMEGLGVVDGQNCIAWRTIDDLARHATRVVSTRGATWQKQMRAEAAQLVRKLHTWTVRMDELVAIVDAVRASSARLSPENVKQTNTDITFSSTRSSSRVVARKRRLWWKRINTYKK